MPRGYTPEKKAEVLKRVSEIGAPAAAKEAGVSYNTILKWIKHNVPTGAKTENTKSVEEKITATLDQIKAAEETLRTLKAELKVLKKEKEKADKEKAALAEAEKKEKLLEAVLKSGKTLEEVLEFLK